MTEDKTTITDNEVMDITELFTEFMGYRLYDGGSMWFLGENFGIEKSKYLPNQDWRLLMPVWYKFRDLDTSVFELLDYSRYKRYWYELANDIPRKPIEHVCKLLAEGIRWYNSTTQNKEQS